MKELNQITNQIISESEELLEHLEELLEYLDDTLELEQIRQELVELKEERTVANKIMFAMSTMTALYGLMLAVKIIMVTIG